MREGSEKTLGQDKGILSRPGYLSDIQRHLRLTHDLYQLTLNLYSFGFINNLWLTDTFYFRPNPIVYHLTGCTR